MKDPTEHREFYRAYWKNGILVGVRKDGTDKPISDELGNEIWIRNHLFWFIGNMEDGLDDPSILDGQGYVYAGRYRRYSK